MTDFKDKKVAILGWGVDTKDVVPFLVENGAHVTVFDKKRDLEGIGEFVGIGNWELGKDDFGDLSGFDVIIRNPSVYRYRKEIVDAEKSGVEISSKIKIFFDVCPAKIIGVTGTKGKGTTSTLIFEILKANGNDVYLGGNIGTGVFQFLPKLNVNSWVVLELSSFQLIDLHKSPHIAVVLMTTLDHMDWHVSEKEYVDAKKSITKFQTPNDFTVYNSDYPSSAQVGQLGLGHKITVSRNDPGVPFGKIKLKGPHNLENVAAAVAVAKIVGVTQETIGKVVSEFKGLEHRLEEVAVINGAAYINDSFSTVPDTCIAAIKSFSSPIILIAGGSDKGADFDELGKVIADSTNIKAVISIGLMADRIEKAVRKYDQSHLITFVRKLQNMTEIVQTAYNMAIDGDVVLLSPACASFDMFKNYKDRGNQFREAVQALL